MKKTFIISAITVITAIIALIIFNRVTSGKEKVNLFAEAEKGTFEITITAAGELVAEKSIDIRGPVFAQNEEERDDHGSQGRGSSGSMGRGGPSIQVRSMDMHAMDLKIQDLVPEGTIVKEGDFVAQLDRTNYDNTLRDEIENLETMKANLELKVLDTAMTMTSLRDQIKNQKYAVEEANIELDQAKFEPPAVVRKAETNLDRQKRSLDQLTKNYSLRASQTLVDINTSKMNLDRKERLVKDLGEYVANFTIKAPAAGMIIYKKDHHGTKRITGSSINAFDMVVATLPDLSSMISKIYVNEIEVSRVRPGQNVEIVVDAFPGRKYSGKVISIGNVGEQLPNSDAKMFETLILLDGTDPSLRPAMTTGNKIFYKTIEDVVYIPTECIQTGSDSIPFVYLRNRTRHVVVLGESNDKHTIIEQGLEPGSSVYIITPEDPEQFRLIGEALIPVIKEREKARKAENKVIR